MQTKESLISDFQSVADKCQIDFSANILYSVYENEFLSKYNTCKREDKKDFVIEKMNYLLETMIEFYKPMPGGRRNGSHY